MDGAPGLRRMEENPEAADGEEDEQGGVGERDEAPEEAEEEPGGLLVVGCRLLGWGLLKVRTAAELSMSRMRRARTRVKAKRAVVMVISQGQRTAYCMAAG